MSRSGSDNEGGVKRQEIAPGITLEKYQERLPGGAFYVMHIELKLFTVLDFTVDFSGSSNVELEGQSGLVKSTTISPFSKVEIARLKLGRKWNVKVKFKFSMKAPSLEMQRDFIRPMAHRLEEETDAISFLKNTALESVGPSPELALRTLLQKRGLQFVDHEFPPTDSSLGGSEQQVFSQFEFLARWRRAKEIALTEEQLAAGQELTSFFPETLSPMEVKQGKLADCWLLSALAAAAQTPKLLRRLFLSEPNRQGCLAIKLCRTARWQTMIMDDLIPCQPTGEPLCARSESRAVWVPLLEKAFAKLLGGYPALRRGEARSGLIDLTGCPAMTILLTEPKIRKQVESGQLWRRLTEALSRGFLVVAGTKDLQSETEGLSKLHAYSILRVAEVEHSRLKQHPLHKIKGVTRLLNVQNPWGVFEWTGDWSDSSPLWTPETKALVGADPKADDGNFWISWENFLENFAHITICQVAGWHELRMRGKFVRGIDQNNEKHSLFCSRWYYAVEVRQAGRVVFGIHQEDNRAPGVAETRPYVDLGLALLRAADGGYTLVDFKNSAEFRERFLEVELPPGEYLLVPRSVGNCLNFPREPRPVTDLSPANPLLKSIARDLFEKYDIIANGLLSFRELSSFYEYLGMHLTESDFAKVIKTHSRPRLEPGGPEGLDLHGFKGLFFSLLAQKSPTASRELLHKLGYDQYLFSFRTRVFTLSVHSEHPVSLSVRDALADNIDFAVTKLLARSFGKSIDETQTKPGVNPPEVEGFYYFNEYLNQPSP